MINFIQHTQPIGLSSIRFSSTRIDKEEINPFKNSELKNEPFLDKFSEYVLYAGPSISELQEKAPKSGVYQWLVNKKYALEEMDYNTQIIQAVIHNSITHRKGLFAGTRIDKDEINPFKNPDLKDMAFKYKFAEYVAYAGTPLVELDEKAPKSQLHQWLCKKRYTMEQMCEHPLGILLGLIMMARTFTWLLIGSRNLALALAHVKLPDEDPTLPDPPASYEGYQKLNFFEKGLYRYYFKQPVPTIKT